MDPSLSALEEAAESIALGSYLSTSPGKASQKKESIDNTEIESSLTEESDFTKTDDLKPDT